MKLISKDIHNHLLPGVDDGFRNPESSLTAIRQMVDLGYRDLVFTPHINPDVYPETTEDGIKEVYSKFVKQIPVAWGIHTSLAAEYMVVHDFEKRVEQDPSSLLAYDDHSILIEMSYMYRSDNLEKTIFALNMAGFKPILAHPERYTYMAEFLSDFDRIVGMGCRLQMNYMSLTGAYGTASMTILRHLLKNDMYSFVATDLHSLSQLQKIKESRPVGFKTRRRYDKFRKKLT